MASLGSRGRWVLEASLHAPDLWWTLAPGPGTVRPSSRPAIGPLSTRLIWPRCGGAFPWPELGLTPLDETYTSRSFLDATRRASSYVNTFAYRASASLLRLFGGSRVSRRAWCSLGSD